jgi:hypothetical protein
MKLWLTSHENSFLKVTNGLNIVSQATFRIEKAALVEASFSLVWTHTSTSPASNPQVSLCESEKKHTTQGCHAPQNIISSASQEDPFTRYLLYPRHHANICTISFDYFMCFFIFLKRTGAGFWWLTPVILTTQKAQIRRIAVWSQAQANSSHKTLFWKNPSQNKTGGEAQSAGPEFKP